MKFDNYVYFIQNLTLLESAQSDPYHFTKEIINLVLNVEGWKFFAEMIVLLVLTLRWYLYTQKINESEVYTPGLVSFH